MIYTNIFIIDDNPTTIFYNKDVVLDFSPNSKIYSYQNPIEFINEFSQLVNSSNAQSLILLDINMPEMRGFEMIEELEENNTDFANVDILIVSSSNLKFDQEKASRFSNIIGYIEKPISIEKLNNATQR